MVRLRVQGTKSPVLGLNAAVKQGKAKKSRLLTYILKKIHSLVTCFQVKSNVSKLKMMFPS